VLVLVVIVLVLVVVLDFLARQQNDDDDHEDDQEAVAFWPVIVLVLVVARNPVIVLVQTAEPPRASARTPPNQAILRTGHGEDELDVKAAFLLLQPRFFEVKQDLKTPQHGIADGGAVSQIDQCVPLQSH
jgi:hypothetical protein